MATDRPIVDGRDADAIREAAEAIVPHYTDRWDPDADDVGGTLLALFAEMAGDVIDRLDQVPAKHRVAFFDALGFGHNPPQPARVPLTVLVPADIEQNVAIPAGTQAVAPAEGARPEQIFELPAGGGFEATPASVTAVYTVDPDSDDVYAHHPTLAAGEESHLFAAADVQRHALLIGHADLLTLKGGSRIWVTVSADASSIAAGLWEELQWEFYGELPDEDPAEDWHDLDAIVSTTESTVSVRLQLPVGAKETTKSTIAGAESRWIRCRAPTDAERGRPATPDELQSLFDIEVSSVSLSLTPPAGETDDAIRPDQLLSVDVPIEVPAPDEDPTVVAPFGDGWPPRPTFYVASEEVLTKAGTKTTLHFHPTTREDTEAELAGTSIQVSDQYSNGLTVTVDRVAADLASSQDRAIVEVHSQADELLGRTDELTPGIYRDVVVEVDLSPLTGTTEQVTVELYQVDAADPPGELLASAQATVTLTDRRPPSLSWEYWDGEGWSLLPDVSDETKALRQSGTVSFTVPADLEPTTAAGHEGHWIRVRIVSGDYVRLDYDTKSGQTMTVGAHPRFGGVTLVYEPEDDTAELPAHLVTDNNLTSIEESPPSETGTRLRPFSGLSDEQQTLYLGFDRTLRDGPIQLLFSLADQEYLAEFYPRVRWEHRPDPKVDAWVGLEAVDGTESLTRRGIVALTFVEPTAPSVRFGRERHWVRARVDGNRFVPATAEPADAAMLPVTIEGINAGAQQVVLGNDTSRPLDVGGYQIAFACAGPGDRRRTFPAGTTVPPRGILTVKTDSEPDAAVHVHFEYEAPALDECVVNAVAVLTPDGREVTRRLEGVPDPCERWLETVPPAGRPTRTPPILRGIHPNTGWVTNVRSIEGEILGSSDGTADQAFTVSTPPVIEPAVWVDELSGLSEGERRTLREDETVAVQERTASDGGTVAFWVRWTEVEHFLDSGPEDRHYTLDPTIGRVVFGDGVRGRIPPREPDGIRIDYRSGGGAAGNLPAGAVTDLKSSISYVDEVMNPEPADGGADGEPLEAVLDRAPRELKDRNRAVTAADFERIAMAASRRLARARCIPAMDEAGDHSPGWVTLLIVPTDTAARPVPSVELKQRVAAAVRDRAPATLVAGADDPTDAEEPTPDLVVRGPSYVTVSVDTTVAPGAVGSRSALETSLAEAIDAFLHPLTGGDAGTGWQFGELPCLSDLYALLERVDGVDHVEALSLTFQGDEEPLTITEGEAPPSVAPDTLVHSGSHRITVDGTHAVSSTGRH